MRPIGIGIVGCGVVATSDLLPNLVLPDARARLDLVAVCDVVEARARETAERFGARRAYADPVALARDPDVEIVGVTTPVRHHLPVALAAIEAGKHVYVQKTMTETVEEADRLIAAARARGVKIVAAPGNHVRSRPLREIREHVEAGRLGKLCWGRSALGTRHEDDARRLDDPERNVDPTWYYRPGGGPLRDAAVYDLHALTWMLGPARRVTAMSGISLPVRRWRDREIRVELDDNTHFILEWEGPCYVVFSSHFVKGSSRTPRLELYGERGAVVMGGGARGAYELYGEAEERDRHGKKERLELVGEPTPPGSALVGVENYVVADAVHLADCLLEDREPVVSAEHARHVIEIIEAVYRSARAGRALDLVTTFARY
jgi:predicted dehydrogenase